MSSGLPGSRALLAAVFRPVGGPLTALDHAGSLVAGLGLWLAVAA